MKSKLGPHVQMVKLGREMASIYEKDKNLALGPLLSHYLDEVDINIASDTFDHLGFLAHLRDDLLPDNGSGPDDDRRTEFLHAAAKALGERAERHEPQA